MTITTSKSVARRLRLQMSKREILIKKNRQVLVPVHLGLWQSNAMDRRILAFQAEVMRLGFMMDQKLLEAISKLEDIYLIPIYNEVISILSKLVGDDVDYKPFYPNFPRQVLEASDVELFFNAILHYWTFGDWRPSYNKDARLPAFENVDFKILTLGTEEDVRSVLTAILGTNASTSAYDKNVMTYLLDVYPEAELVTALPEQIPFKEQLCTFVAECLAKDYQVLGVSSLKTATDILRVVTHLSGGDISLATNTKFKSMKRSLRRALVQRLEQVINVDDIARHRGRWVALAHSLHVGEYKRMAPRACQILADARSKTHKFRSFDSQAEDIIVNGDAQDIHDLLKTRPGNYARRLDHILRLFTVRTGNKLVRRFFAEVADKVDTRLLLQLYGHFKTRNQDVTKRVVYPKGSIAKAQLLRNTLPALGKSTVSLLLDGIRDTLNTRFALLSDMGKVFIDPTLKDCPIPLSLRSASDALEVVARGTKIAFSDKKTLRMFIYWVGIDIDLSAVAYNEDFSKSFHISYTNLREKSIRACHSGDIVRAPNGATEFIDIDIDSALKVGVRYVQMSVYVYNGPNFDEHKKCYAGWMTRDCPNKNEIYDPKTVEQKIDLQAKSRTAIPVVFDLKERKAIWLDLVAPRNMHLAPNNLESNRATLLDTLEGALSLDNKPTLYDLFTMHAKARGEIVDDVDEADTVFSWSGDVKPTDASIILSEYL